MTAFKNLRFMACKTRRFFAQSWFEQTTWLLPHRSTTNTVSQKLRFLGSKLTVLFLTAFSYLYVLCSY